MADDRAQALLDQAIAVAEQRQTGVHTVLQSWTDDYERRRALYEKNTQKYDHVNIDVDYELTVTRDALDLTRQRSRRSSPRAFSRDRRQDPAVPAPRRGGLAARGALRRCVGALQAAGADRSGDVVEHQGHSTRCSGGRARIEPMTYCSVCGQQTFHWPGCSRTGQSVGNTSTNDEVPLR